jgi:stress response protein YsnF
MSNSETRIPITEEGVEIGTRRVTTGQVRVEIRTQTVEEIAEAALETTGVEVIRVPIDREVDTVPKVRSDGEVTIIPVVEEQVVLTKRLVLKEEIHVRRHRSVETVQVPVSLRRQQAVVTRSSAGEQNDG